MGQRQSQIVQNFLNNNVNTTAVSDVISSYATRTNAVTSNVQDLCVNIAATGDIDFGTTGFQANQEIESLINVQTLVDRADRADLVNDLQRTISEELRNALERTTGGIDIFEASVNQELRNTILNNLDSYVNQTVNLSSIDEVLLSASNVQRGCYNFSAANVRGPLVINQRIQSNIMAENLLRSVIERAVSNREVQNIITRAEGQLVSENTLQVPGLNLFGNIGSIVLYILGGLAILAGIIAAFLLPTTITVRIVAAAIGIVLGIGLIAVGIFLSRSATRRVGSKKSKV